MLLTYAQRDIQKLIHEFIALTPGWKIEWEDVTFRSRRVTNCFGMVISIYDEKVVILWSWEEPMSFEQLRKVEQQHMGE